MSPAQRAPSSAGRRISHTSREVKDSGNVLSFGETGGGGWQVWDRFLQLDGKPAFHIGNVCGTCHFFFERLQGANRTLSIDSVRTRLNDGIGSLADPVVDAFAALVPNGPYEVVLESVRPQLVEPGAQTDYFAHEQPELWGVDPFWDLPHDPRVRYYRAGETALSDGQVLFEFVVPFVARRQLDPETIKAHRARLRSGAQPTAVALSVLDVKEPAFIALGEGPRPAVTSHWCWAHYLLDGHHRVLAAAEEEATVTLLSFLAISKGISTPENIAQALAALAGKAT